MKKHRREENWKIHAISPLGKPNSWADAFKEAEWLGKRWEESIDCQIGGTGKMLNAGDLLQGKTYVDFFVAGFHLCDLKLIWELVPNSLADFLFLTNEQTKSLPGFVDWRETSVTLTGLGETEREESIETKFLKWD